MYLTQLLISSPMTKFILVSLPCVTQKKSKVKWAEIIIVVLIPAASKCAIKYLLLSQSGDACTCRKMLKYPPMHSKPG